MSLPTKINIQTLDYSYLGSPWVRVTTKSSIDLDGLDYSYLGQPFWGIETPEALTAGTVCWGHDTGVTETNIRDFTVNWTGTGAIINPGVADTEYIELNAGEVMTSEVVNTGVITVVLEQNHYSAGDDVNMDYRTGATEALCLAAGWNDYSVPFASEGYVQVRLTSTL